MSRSQDIMIETRDLAVGYKQRGNRIVILEHLNLTLRAGELVCFMGPNGVGKSTLLRSICGVQPVLGGTVVIMKNSLEAINPTAMSKMVSLVLTDRVNAGNLTVRELVALGRYPYLGWNISFSDQDKNIIDQAIERSGIASYKDKKVYELSDGQLQKAMIGRALCQDAPILILDEPTAHLDLNNRISIINLLKELAQDTGKSILMATHELDLALQAADRLWLAGKSGIIEEGLPEDLVLNGSLDRIFELKGYDLKTGQLEHKTSTRFIKLEGEGYLYLWTKNALERNGFGISTEAPDHIIVRSINGTNLWNLNNEKEFQTIEELLQKLNPPKK